MSKERLRDWHPGDLAFLIWMCGTILLGTALEVKWFIEGFIWVLDHVRIIVT